MTKLLLINGPNLQLLGSREPEVYGKTSLAELETRLQEIAGELQVELEFFQSNHEGDIVDRLGKSGSDGTAGIMINPAAYTHTSVAIRDALAALAIPALEVHISNIHAREEFRQNSLTAGACLGQISGLGMAGYEWALRALTAHLQNC